MRRVEAFHAAVEGESIAAGRRQRATRAWSALLAALVSIGPLAPVAAQVVDPDFWTPDGNVYATARAGSTLYVAGSFNRISPWTGSFVVLDSASAALAPGWPRVEGDVRACIPDGAGGWYLGGTFTRIAGVARMHLAHLRADRTLDAWDPGADGPVNALARNGSSIVVGGSFTRIAGEARGPLAAVDAGTGTLTAWDPRPLDPAEICAIAVNGNTVYVGGWFTHLGGQARNRLAALDATSGQVQAWNPDADFVVYAIVARGPTVYVGGGFTKIGGDPRSRLAAVDSASGIATDWNPSPLGLVYALEPGATSLFVGGGFHYIGGQQRQGLAEVSLATGLATAWRAHTDNTVRALARSGPVLYAGGDFASVGGAPRSFLAALDAGSGQVLPWNPQANGAVHALGVAGGRVFAGGRFATFGGVPRPGLAAIDLATGQPTSWSPMAQGGIVTLAPFGSTIFVGGSFTYFAGQPRGGLAAVDAESGQLLPYDAHAAARFYPTVSMLKVAGSRLYVSGNFSSIGGQPRTNFAALSPQTAVALPWNPQPDGAITGVEVSGPVVYLAGWFSAVGGRARAGLAALDATTGLASSWNPAPDGPLFALVLDGTRLLVGGYLTGIGGLARGFVAAVDTATAAATPWDPNANSRVTSLVQLGGTVYAGGEFSLIGGQERIGLAALDGATGTALPWDAGLMRTPTSLATDDSAVYVGSSGADWLGNWAPTLTRLLPAPASPPVVTALAPSAGDTLVIGQVHRLEWAASIAPPGVQSVDLYVSRSGAAGPWERVAAGAANTGWYDWTVSGPEADASCFLRVDARDFAGQVGSDVGAAPFSILELETPALITLFRAVPTADGVRVEWRVSDELSPYPATVERAVAADGPWSALQAEAGREGENWVMLDRTAGQGRWWYRLVVTLPGGARITCAPVALDLQRPVTAFALSPLAPNPSNGTGVLSYSVPHRAHVRLSLFDVQGRELAVLVDAELPPGSYGAALDARDLPAGLYFLRLRSAGVDLGRRIVIAP